MPPVSEPAPRNSAPLLAKRAALAAAAACIVAALSVGASAWIAVVAMLLAAIGCAWAAQRMDRVPSQPAQADAPPPAPAAPPLEPVAVITPLLEAMPDPALLIDSEGRILACNAGARGKLAFDGPGGRLSSILRRPELLDAAHAAAHDLARRAVDYEPTGQVEEHFRVHVAPVALPGGTAALMVFDDLTTQINSERMRADFLAYASHELRTPLASLTLLIETLSGHARNDPAAQERFLGLMHIQADRMRRLIDDLLSLSKIEANEHVPPAELVDLAKLAHEAAETLEPIGRARKVEIEVEAMGETWVVGDPFQLAQVAQNLVDNAIKYSEPGAAVTLQVGAAETREEVVSLAGRQWPSAGRISLLFPPPAPSRRYAYLRVVDSGPGIDRRHLPRLSERFYRVEREDHSERTGTGLGLAIVKHIMNRHRGGFVVESEIGRGSAFAIFLEKLAEAKAASAA